VPEKKLDLLQLAAVKVTEFRACPSQIVWRYVIQFHPLSTAANNIPDHILSAG
jgi:hypothetical protein